MSAEDPTDWNAERRSGRGALSNRTIEALLRRGLDSDLARHLQAAGQTVDRLKQASDAELESLGLDEAQRAAVRQGGRAAIPSQNLAAVLWANRWTCCVCRQPDRPIVVHHINPWARSRDHSPANLAVVCTDHHAHAHRRGDLEQNLTPERLRLAKTAREVAVRDLDAQAILAASRVQGHHWLWFNHRRLMETAEALGINRLSLVSFAGAYRLGYVDEEGRPMSGDPQQPYVAAGGDGDYLLAYLAEMFRAVMSRSAVFNISDHLDRGFLARVIKPGDLILVQGRHVFKERTKRNYGPGQLIEVRRQANGVRVSFTIDRWEAIATSAWGSWLRGFQRVASVVRINEVLPGEKALELRCSGLAVGLALDGLSTRSYALGTWPEPDEEGDEDNWLDEVLTSFDDA